VDLKRQKRICSKLDKQSEESMDKSVLKGEREGCGEKDLQERKVLSLK